MTETKRPLKVFLCHAHTDRDAVRTLYTRLKREGVDVWLDKEKLLPGADWEYEIRKAVREADVVVVCLSKQFNQAGFRQKEVRIALDAATHQPDGEIFIIPARLEECENLESLSKWHWVDLFEDGGYQSLIRALRARADRIGATLRIRRGGKSISSHPTRKEDEETDRERAEIVAIEKVRLEAEEQAKIKAAKEKAEREAAENAAREKAEKDVAEKARLEEEELARQKAMKEKTDREAAEKEKADLEAIGKAARKTEEDEKEIQRILEKSIKKARRDLWWGKLKIDIRYRFRVIYIYRVPILILLATLAIVTPLLIRLSNLIPEIITTFNNAPTATIGLTLAPQSSTNSTEAFIPLEILTPSPTSTEVLVTTPTSLPTEIADAKGVSMVLVPAGEFTMGSDELYRVGPGHTVYLDVFYIDKYEVSNVEYAKCVADGDCLPPQQMNSLDIKEYYGNPDYDSYPVIYVTWDMANSYCTWRGINENVNIRLPTEAEWEKSARGADERRYPWGDSKFVLGGNFCDMRCPSSWDDADIDDGYRELAPVSSFSKGVSPYGVYNMAGNVWEWVADWYVEYNNEYPDVLFNPSGPQNGTGRVARGGSWKSVLFQIETSYRAAFDPLTADNNLGFRCAMDAP